MSNTSGVGGTPSPNEPSEMSELEKMPGGQNVMQEKVATLGQLKAVLIQHFGEKNGTKFYNQFIQTFAMMMLEQIQQAAQHAQQAAQQMRMSGGLTS